MSWVTSTSGHLLLLMDSHDQIENEARVHAVEVAGRFVREEHGRAIGQAPRYGDALPFAAGQFGRKMVEPMLQADRLEQVQERAPLLCDGRRSVSNIGICTFSNAVKVGSR